MDPALLAMLITLAVIFLPALIVHMVVEYQLNHRPAPDAFCMAGGCKAPATVHWFDGGSCWAACEKHGEGN